jgi:DNA-binding transcriptional regulator GbsR (MarR family)
MAESDFWTVIRNVLSGREMREIQLALEVLGDSVVKLREVEDELPEEEQRISAYALERLADLRSFFQFAQMALETLVVESEEIEIQDISKIQIG